jgi:hypothetical protein
VRSTRSPGRLSGAPSCLPRATARGSGSAPSRPRAGSAPHASPAPNCHSHPLASGVMEKILGSLLVFGLVLPWYFTQKATGSVPAGFSAGLGGLLLTVLVLVWLSVQRDRFQAGLQRRRDLRRVSSGMAAVDQMSGVQFEEFVAAQLRTRGWSVARTARTGDYGVDLIAKKNGTCMAVQCKGCRRLSVSPPYSRWFPARASTAVIKPP